MIWFTLALVAVSFIATILLAPKPKIEHARSQNLDDVNFPMAGEGAPVALALGTVRLRGPNTLWYGDFKAVPIKKKVKTGLFSSKKVIVGYNYFLGMALGLCLGPGVILKRIWMAKDELWAGTAGPDPTAIVINKPNLFGGKEKGGGFTGTLRFYGGSFSQVQNAYLLSKLSPDITPAYVGQSIIVFEGTGIGESAQLRPISFELQRLTDGLGLGAQAVIGEDLNPAELLFQLHTLEWGGLDVDVNDLDIPSFISVGQQLYTEGNGMSVLVTRPNSGKEVIEEVLRQIDGLMYQDPVTGKIILELIREDDIGDLEDLPVVDDTNTASLRNFTRSSWDETLNEVRVNFTNRDNKYETGTAIVQDLANINAQVRRRPTTMTFPGVHTKQLATDLATRELTQLSVPLYKVSLEVNRTAATMRPGDPFIFSWPEYGIEQIIMRVQRFNLGELVDGRVVIDAVQDKFATNLTVFAPPEQTGWVPPTSPAVAPTDVLFTEVPYWLMQQQEELPLPPAAGATYLMVLPRQPNASQITWAADVTQGSETSEGDEADWPVTANLATAVGKLDGFDTGTLSSMTIDGLLPSGSALAAASSTDIANLGSNLFFLNGELMAFQSFTDNGGGQYTLTNVRRALLDTVYVAHAAGSKLFFVTIDGLVNGEWAGTTLATAAVRSLTLSDQSTPQNINTTPRQRYEKPLPPDNVKVNTVRSGAHGLLAGTTLDVTWSARSRLDTAIKFEQDAASTPETSQLHTVRWYLDNVLKGTYANLATFAQSIPTVPTDVGTVRIEIDAVRSGLTSYNPAIYELTLASSSPPAGPVLYWRVRSDDTHIGGEYMAIAELELFDTLGGADLTPGSTMTASADAGASYNPPKAIDDNNATFWTTGATAPPSGGHWLKNQFAVAKDIIEVSIRVRPDTFREDPVKLFVEKSSDNALFYTVFSALSMAPWSAGEKRVITKPDQIASPNAWRMFPVKCQGSGSWCTITELTFHSTSGGANVATGGWAFSERATAANAFDGNTASTWQNGVGSGSVSYTAARIGYNKASKYDLAEVTVRNGGTTNDSPIAMHFERTLDWNTWTIDWSILTPATWTANETRTFTRPSIPGAAEYWRLVPLTATGNAFSLATLELRETVGGPNVALAANIASYMADASYSGLTPQNAFDANASTIWGTTSQSQMEAYVGCRFSSARNFAQIAITARNDGFYTQTPTRFVLQKSLDGVSWLTVKEFNTTWSSAGQTQTFNI